MLDETLESHPVAKTVFHSSSMRLIWGLSSERTGSPERLSNRIYLAARRESKSRCFSCK